MSFIYGAFWTAEPVCSWLATQAKALVLALWLLNFWDGDFLGDGFLFLLLKAGAVRRVHAEIADVGWNGGKRLLIQGLASRQNAVDLNSFEPSTAYPYSM